MKGKYNQRFWGMVLMASLFISGCGANGTNAANGRESGTQATAPVTALKAITLGNPPEGGLEELYEQLDALTIPELNCTLRFEFIPWGDERKQINIATASGEYDFIPGGVFSDYRTLISKNAFLNINNYLELVPELEAHYTEYYAGGLEACEINGGLFGIPQFGLGGVKNSDEGFFYREDLRKEWDLDEVAGLETLEAYLYRAKQEERYQDEPLITDNRIWSSLWLMLTKGKYIEVNSMLETPFVVVEAANPSVVLNRMETPEFLEVLSYIKKWRDDGILESDMLAFSDNEGDRGKQLMLADKKPCETNATIWPLNNSYIPMLTEAHPDWEYAFFPYVSNNQNWYSSSLAEASVISISSKTKSPETAIRLLEKIHTDLRYYRLVAYGAEGIHYNLEGEYLNYEGIDQANRFSGWTACSDDLLKIDSIPYNIDWHEGAWTKTTDWMAEISQKSEANPLNGFVFLINGLENEISSIEQVRLKYFRPLLCGYTEDYAADLEIANEALRGAGFDEYLTGMQQQVEALGE